MRSAADPISLAVARSHVAITQLLRTDLHKNKCHHTPSAADLMSLAVGHSHMAIAQLLLGPNLQSTASTTHG
jgi:hypothetical protein